MVKRGLSKTMEHEDFAKVHENLTVSFAHACALIDGSGKPLEDINEGARIGDMLKYEIEPLTRKCIVVPKGTNTSSI